MVHDWKVLQAELALASGAERTNRRPWASFCSSSGVGDLAGGGGVGAIGWFPTLPGSYAASAKAVERGGLEMR